MRLSTLQRLRCPQRACGDNLALMPDAREAGGDIRGGSLRCQGCNASYPILGGVALLVTDPFEYILMHAKGIAREAASEPEILDDLPNAVREDFEGVLAELNEAETEHYEEDLESERVNALYFMNHFLRVNPNSEDSQERDWWKTRSGETSPLIDKLVREYWDDGPFARIRDWISAESESLGRKLSVVEPGCGLGGLARELAPSLKTYLGVDLSFASIALARRLVEANGAFEIKIPDDLLSGPVSRQVKGPAAPIAPTIEVDFVVGELDQLAVQEAAFDASIVLNAIDMIDDPSALPREQARLVRPGGLVIQSGPYIWHENVARRLRSLGLDSANVVKSLYERAGLTIERQDRHLPWLFFKHARQLEVYSVHLLSARKPR